MSKELEALECIVVDLTPIAKEHNKEEIEQVKKSLEVLDIIKNKNVNIRALKSWNKTYKGKLTYQNYLDILEDCDLGEKLTQKEFALLKEVLLCVKN